jgi:hypothetical protein
MIKEGHSEEERSLYCMKNSGKGEWFNFFIFSGPWELYCKRSNKEMDTEALWS